MIFEHFALNVPDPAKVAHWYANNLGMEIVRAMKEEPFTHFIADRTGRVVMELYCNKEAEIPDYKNEHPLKFHVAFAVSYADYYKNKLMAEGAKFIEEVFPEHGSHLVMLRDPFGIPLQLCQRVNSFAIQKEKLSKFVDSLN